MSSVRGAVDEAGGPAENIDTSLTDWVVEHPNYDDRLGFLMPAADVVDMKLTSHIVLE